MPSTIQAAFAPFLEELRRLLPAGAAVVDAHTHLGADEDGQRLAPDQLLGDLDLVAPDARACTFALHDPDRTPAYRVPNDRVLEWTAASGGRLLPYCRLDPSEEPIEEAERCLALGVRGIKLHPRAQAFSFDTPVMDAIFATARDAGVPILVHAGRGMAPMDDLAAVALRHPEVTLVLAHAGIAGQGMFATKLAGHPAVLYDTSCFSPFDVVELFARVPAERIVFASDAPYGRPVQGLYQALRVAALAGLDDDDRRLLAGATMAAVLAGEPLPAARAPRLSMLRPAGGALLRTASYLMMALGSHFGGGGGPHAVLEAARVLPFVAMARTVGRDPRPGAAGPALARIDAALMAAEELLVEGGPETFAVLGLLHGAIVIAATEPLG